MNPAALKHYSQQAQAIKAQGKPSKAMVENQAESEEQSGFESLLFQLGGQEGMPLEVVEGGVFEGQELINELAPLLKQIGKAEQNGEEIPSAKIAELLTKNLELSQGEKTAVQDQIAKLGIKFDGEQFVQLNGKGVPPQQLIAQVQNSVKMALSKLNSETSDDSFGEPPLMRGDFGSGFPNKMPANAMMNRPIVSGQDFINNMKMMNNRQAVVITDQGPQVANLGQKAYANESSLFETNLLSSKKGQVKEGQANGGQQQTLMDVITGNDGQTQTNLNLSLDNKIDPEAYGKAEQAGRVLNLSHIPSENGQALINKITNYIQQNNLANQDSVEMFVRHDDLGIFKIQAKRGEVGNTVDLTIATSTIKGNEFFAHHEAELLKGLNQSGIKISDFKIVTSSENIHVTTDQSKGQSSGEWSQQQRSQQFSQSGTEQQRQDADRRKELWQRYQDNLSA